MECSALTEPIYNRWRGGLGWALVAELDGGALTSDPGGVLLGGRHGGLVRRLAGCFRDAREREFGFGYPTPRKDASQSASRRIWR